MSILVPDWLTCVVFLCGVVIAHNAVSKFKAYIKLRHISGSTWANFTSWQHRAALLRYRPAEWYAQIIDDYGPIAKVAPNLIITSLPELWMHINTKPGYARADWFFLAMRVDYQHDHLFSLTDISEHERRRKLVGPGFSGAGITNFEASIDERLKELLHLIRSKYMSSDIHTQSVDLAAKVQYFAHDTISTLTFGEPFNMLRNDADRDNYIQSIKEGFQFANILVAFGLTKLSQSYPIGPILAYLQGDGGGYGKLLELSVRMIEKRVTNPRDAPEDILDSFIQHGLRGDELRSEILDAVVIGSFAPTHAISSVILLTMTNPHVLSKVQREIDGTTKFDKSGITGGIVTFARTKQLPYLQAVIRESLRMLPPIVGLFPRQVPPEGDSITINGKNIHLPGSTFVGRSVYSMYRCKDTYGEDADTFRPERWLESSPVKLARMMRVNELIFNHGRYQCMGKVIAHMEITKTVFELLQNFEFALIHPNKAPWTAVDLFGINTLSNFDVQIRNRTVNMLRVD